MKAYNQILERERAPPVHIWGRNCALYILVKHLPFFQAVIMNAYTRVWNLVLKGAPRSLPASTTTVGYSMLGVLSPLHRKPMLKGMCCFAKIRNQV